MLCLRAGVAWLGVGVCALMMGCAAVTQPNDFSGLKPAGAADPPPASTAMVVSADVPARVVDPSAAAVSTEDIIDWTLHGVCDDVIIDRVLRSPTVFRLSTSEEVHLLDAGVSADVVRAMKATAH